jgi:flagellar motor switch protein FliM
MSGLLDPSQIAALFEQASEGTLPEAPAPEPTGGGRRRWLRTVDFSRPTKFTTDQERRLRRALDTFCNVTFQRVKAEHRLPIELEVIDVQQLTWAGAFDRLPAGGVHATLECAPHEGRMLLSSEVPLLLVALERLMGGSADERLPDRTLTDIDLSIIRRLLGTFADCLSTVFFDLCEMTLALGDVETQAELVQVASAAEPTLTLIMEARLAKVTSTFVLLVPYASIAPVETALGGRDDELPPRDEAATAAVRDGLGRVDVTLRAELASTELTLGELLALQPGDLVALDGGSEVVVFADRTPVLTGRPGRAGSARAVQVLRVAEEQA